MKYGQGPGHAHGRLTPHAPQNSIYVRNWLEFVTHERGKNLRKELVRVCDACKKGQIKTF